MPPAPRWPPRLLTAAFMVLPAAAFLPLLSWWLAVDYNTIGDNTRNVLRGIVPMVALSLLFAGVTVAVFLVFPEPLISPFLNPADPDRALIIATGTALLACAALFQLADSMQVMALGLLAGVQDTKVPMILASVSYWIIGIPASYALAFPLGFGGVGLWLGLVIGLAAAAISLMVRFWARVPRA